jgi:hypothetical protein
LIYEQRRAPELGCGSFRLPQSGAFYHDPAHPAICLSHRGYLCAARGAVLLADRQHGLGLHDDRLGGIECAVRVELIQIAYVAALALQAGALLWLAWIYGGE